MDLKTSVYKTNAYASFFDFILYPKEIQHWLISPTTKDIPALSNISSSINTETITKRRHLSFSSLKKIKIAKELGRAVSWIPGLRMIALTGSVAANNSHPEDDIDLLVVTSEHSLWIIRPLILAIVSIFFRRRLPYEDPSQTKDAFCPNLWLDAKGLSIPPDKRNLYTAHEILQIIPIVDKHNTYADFIRQNHWTKQYLANAYHSSLFGARPSDIFKKHKLSTSIFIAPLNYLLYLIQIVYMHPKRTSEAVHLHSAFLHTNNYADKLSNHINTFKVI